MLIKPQNLSVLQQQEFVSSANDISVVATVPGIQTEEQPPPGTCCACLLQREKKNGHMGQRLSKCLLTHGVCCFCSHSIGQTKSQAELTSMGQDYLLRREVLQAMRPWWEYIKHLWEGQRAIENNTIIGHTHWNSLAPLCIGFANPVELDTHKR